MRNLDNQERKSRLFGIELAGLDKEIRRERLVTWLLSSSMPFIVLNFFYQSLTTIMIYQACALTSLQFGYIFLVEEPENTKKPWFWKAMGPLVLLHLIVLALIFSWDKANPAIAGNGWVFTFVFLEPQLIGHKNPGGPRYGLESQDGSISDGTMGEYFGDFFPKTGIFFDQNRGRRDFIPSYFYSAIFS